MDGLRTTNSRRSERFAWAFIAGELKFIYGHTLPQLPGTVRFMKSLIAAYLLPLVVLSILCSPNTSIIHLFPKNLCNFMSHYIHVLNKNFGIRWLNSCWIVKPRWTTQDNVRRRTWLLTQYKTWPRRHQT